MKTDYKGAIQWSYIYMYMYTYGFYQKVARAARLHVSSFDTGIYGGCQEYTAWFIRGVSLDVARHSLIKKLSK